MPQLSVAVRTARVQAIETNIGTSALLRIFTGSPPANCAAASTGTLIAEMALPSDWATTASGVLTQSGTWQDASANNTGTAGYYRLFDTAGTACGAQGLCGQLVTLTTNNTTAAGSAVLNFAATTGVIVGQYVSGTNIPAGSRVIALTATTVTLSQVVTGGGVANGASINFNPELTLDNASINAGQQVNISTFTITDGDA